MDSKEIWMVVTSILILALAWLSYDCNKDPSNKINVVDLFLTKGKLDGSKTRLNLAFLFSSWAMMFLTFYDKLTEWFFTAYIAAWVIDRHGSRSTKQEDKVEE